MTAARQQLNTVGMYLMTPAELNACIGVGAGQVAAIRLPLGTNLRPTPTPQSWARDGCDATGTSCTTPPTTAQPRRCRIARSCSPRTRTRYTSTVNANFESLTDHFAQDPMLHGVLPAFSADLATALDDVDQWHT